MKTKTSPTVKLADGAAIPLEIPATRGAKRPTRRGGFWPGENFAACTRKWDLTGIFSDNAFVLPAILASKSSLAH